MKKTMHFLIAVALTGGLTALVYSTMTSRKSALFQQTHRQQTAREVQQWFFTPDGPMAFSQGEIQRVTPDGQLESLGDGSLQGVVSSRNGHYWVTLQLKATGEMPRVDRQLVLRVYESPGTARYQLSIPLPYDEPYPSLAISDANGSLIVGRATTAELWFYGGDGKLVRHHALLGKADYDLERMLIIHWADQANRVFVLLSRHGTQPVSGPKGQQWLSMHPSLWQFTAEGQILKQQDLGEQMASQLAVDGPGNRIFVALYQMDVSHQLLKQTLVLDSLGQEQARLPLLFKYAAFDSSGEAVVLADNEKAWVYDAHRRKILWDYSLPETNRMITAVGIASLTRRVALLTAVSAYDGNRFYFDQPEITVLESSGKVFQVLQFPEDDFLKPALSMNSRGTRIAVGFRQSFQVFEIQ